MIEMNMHHRRALCETGLN